MKLENRTGNDLTVGKSNTYFMGRVYKPICRFGNKEGKTIKNRT